ncbi:calcium-dependent secretion activator 2-like isoform X3 [Halichondria panicea]|uniref:calcium-dependent secretion activator 2-like isoform X3 n=1 Tax=Halichondria panicea TaxID=6063 RepID=UPI00312B2D2B
MISDRESSSDESDVGGRLGSITAPRSSAAQQRAKFKAGRDVPSVNVETVDFDPMTSISSLRSGRAPSRSPSPAPLDRESSGSIASLDSEFVIVGNTRRASSTIAKWRPLDQGSSIDEEIEEGAVADSLMKSDNFERSQIYLLLARCISYPFTARYQLENSPPKQKLTEEKLGMIVRTLKSVSAGEKVRSQDNALTALEQRLCKQEQFVLCVQWYAEVVLSRNDVVNVCTQGSFSAKELVYIFKVRALKHLTYSSPTRTLNPEDLQLWVNTFRKLVERVSRAFSDHTPLNSEPNPGDAGAPNADKLYKLFQKILKLRNIEHQILYKECQLGNPEEQEAVVRRELQDRKKQMETGVARARELKFGSHKVEEIFREEQLKTLKVLNSNLDQLSLSGPTAHSPATQRKIKQRSAVLTESGSTTVAKQDLQFKLKVTVTLHDLTAIPSNENRPLFCVFEVDGSGEQLKTIEAPPVNNSVSFMEAGEFWTSSPVPQIKLTVMAATKGLISNKTTLSKKTHVGMPSSGDVYTTLDMTKNDKSSESSIGKLKLSTIVERPAIMKKCGFLTVSGDYMFKELKRRFFALIQLSQYKFILTTYSAGANLPKYTFVLDQRFCVEYPTPEDEMFADPTANSKAAMFVLASEESEVGRIRYGCRDTTERDSWMKWLARATGQTIEPIQSNLDVRRESNDLDRYGLQAVVDSVKDITQTNPHKMFEHLFRATLDYRLTEDTFSRGLFSPHQMYVLDEFCARYGVRDLFRHLTCLRHWLVKEEMGVAIWPVMVLSSFRFCQMHIGGSKPMEKSVIVTTDERTGFLEACKQLEEMLSNKIRHFHSSFPYGLPKDDLKVTLKLFDLVVSANQIVGQGGTVDPVKVLTVVMEKSALLNYKKIFSNLNVTDDVALTMTQLADFAQLCIEFMYELHDYYWEDFTQYTQVFSSHLNAFWLFFLVDAREAMSRDNSIISKLQLFHVVNQYFCSQPTLKMAKFHKTFLSEFTSIVSSYMNSLEEQLKTDLAQSFSLETWLPVSDCCQAVEGVVKALHSFKSFVDELGWPEKKFAHQLEVTVATICADRIRDAATQVYQEVRTKVAVSVVTPRYHLPPELTTMINTLVYLESQVMQLCPIHILHSSSVTSLDAGDETTPTREPTPINIEEDLSLMLHDSVTMVIQALCGPMETLLSKLTKHDPRDGFLNSLMMMLPNTIPLDSFNQFLSGNLQLITRHLRAKNFVLSWYECLLQLIKGWLDQRPNFSLLEIQHQSITTLMELIYRTCSEFGMLNHELETDTYKAIEERSKIESSSVDLKIVGQH